MLKAASYRVARRVVVQATARPIVNAAASEAAPGAAGAVPSAALRFWAPAALSPRPGPAAARSAIQSYRRCWPPPAPRSAPCRLGLTAPCHAAAVCLVTGASRGIGRSIALALGAAGARVRALPPADPLAARSLHLSTPCRTRAAAGGHQLRLVRRQG